MEAIIIALLLGIIPGTIGHSKGRSFLGWWLYGVLFFLAALPHSLYMSSVVKTKEKGVKKCPYCTKKIKSGADWCRYCGKELTSYSREVARKETDNYYSQNMTKCSICGKKIPKDDLIKYMDTMTCLDCHTFRNGVSLEKKDPLVTRETSNNATKMCYDCGAVNSYNSGSCGSCGNSL